MAERHGLVALFGSGEIAPSGRKVHDWVMRQVPPPVRAAILETPAGFQPNSELVAGELADFLSVRLQNYKPQVTVIPARKRGTPFSPDNAETVAPLLRSNYIFWGPGSPTYAVKQLEGSLAWYLMVARHRLGAAMVLASAATFASGAFTLPVYEIYKVGDELHWVPGLDFFGPYGLTLAFVCHWNNKEGGAELDTRFGYMGKARFEQLAAMLASEVTIVGIDEHTGLVIDPDAGECRVMGRGGVTVIHAGRENRYRTGQEFAVGELGPFHLPAPEAGIPADIWEQALAAHRELQEEPAGGPPEEVLALVEEREAARGRRDWAVSDELRDRIVDLGWQIRDTAAGPEVLPL